MKAADVREELQSIADPDKAAILQQFFKTGSQKILQPAPAWRG
jgi:hypothetical protein